MFSRFIRLAVLIGWSIVASSSFPQAGLAQTAEEAEGRRIVQLNGSVGFLAEAYSASGIGNRRAPGRVQLSAAASATKYGMTYGLDALLSTDQSRVRQSLSRFGLDFRYRWLRVAGGTVTPTLSPYSLSGVTLRGGLVEMTPGPFLFTVTGGRSQRAASGALAFAPSFRRTVYAARLGAGQEQGTHVFLTGVLARDDTTGAGVDGGVPQENVSLSPDVGLSLFRNRLSIRVQGTASAITRDTRTEELAVGGWPDGLVHLHAGTRIDYAAQAAARLNLRRVMLESDYERIQPGFASLGQPNLRSDQERIGLGASLRLRRVRLSLRLRQSRNNLLGQRTATLQRQRVQTQAQVQLSEAVSMGASYSLLLTNSEGVRASGASLREQRAHLLTLTPTAVLRRGNTTHTVSLAATVQVLRTRMPSSVAVPASGTGFDNHTAALTYGLSFPSGLSFNAGGTYMASSAAAVEVRAQALNLGGAYAFSRGVSIDLNGGWSANRVSIDLAGSAEEDASRQLSLDAGFAYRLPFGDTVRLTMRGLSNSHNGGPGFRETTATLRYEHRF